MKPTQIVESFITKGQILEHASDKNDAILCRAKYEICSIGEKNRNNRVYEKAVWDKVLADPDITAKLENKSLFFHAEHPSTTQSNTEKVAGVVTEMILSEDKHKVYAVMEVLDTPYGRIVDTLLRAGCGIGVSTRADGELEETLDEAGGSYQRVVPESYRFVTIDFTADPSTFGSELPITVERDVTQVIKTGLDDKKIDRQYATVLLERLYNPEAVALLEKIKNDVQSENCTVETSEKECLTCMPVDELVNEIVKKVEDRLPIKESSKEEALAKGQEMVKKYPQLKAEITELWSLTQIEIEDGEGDASEYSKFISSMEELVEDMGTKESVNENQVNLDKIQSWLSDTTENMDDWDWDGTTLSVFSGDNVEKYSKKDLIDAGVFESVNENVEDEKKVVEEKKCKVCGKPAKKEWDAEDGSFCSKECLMSFSDVDEKKKIISTSDLCGQPADAKAAQVVVNKSSKKTKKIKKKKKTKVKESDMIKIADLHKLNELRGKFKVGDKVHIDTDNKEWGRVASDGTIQKIGKSRLLVNVNSIRADIYVPLSDVQMKENLERKTNQFLTDNWGNFHSHSDAVDNIVKVFKIDESIADTYVTNMESTKGNISAVTTRNNEKAKPSGMIRNKSLKKMSERLVVITAERDRLVESYGKDMMAFTIKMREITEQFQELHDQVKILQTQSKQKTEVAESLTIDIGKLTKQLNKLNESTKKSKDSHLLEIKSIKEEEEKDRKEITEKYEQEANVLQEAHKKDLISFYVSMKTKSMGLHLPESSLTLLEACRTVEEVDSLIRRTQNAIRENIVQSANGISEIVMESQSDPNPAMTSLRKKVGTALKHFGV